MKKLTKQQIDERSKLCARLRLAAAAVETQIADYNRKTSELGCDVTAAIDGYNSAVQDAKEFAEQIACDAQAFIDDRSERWVESDAGKDYVAWKDEWEGAELEEISVELPDEFEEPEMSAADVLEQLAEEVSV